MLWEVLRNRQAQTDTWEEDMLMGYIGVLYPQWDPGQAYEPYGLAEISLLQGENDWRLGATPTHCEIEIVQ